MQKTCFYCTDKECSTCICKGCSQTHCHAYVPSECMYASKKILWKKEIVEPESFIFDLTNVSLPIVVDYGKAPDMLEGASNNFELQPVNDSKGEY